MPTESQSFRRGTEEQSPRPLDRAGFPTGQGRVYVEAVSPSVDGGDFPAKRVVGDRVVVRADLIADGHDVVQGAVVASLGSRERRVPLAPLGNDRHEAAFEVDALGSWQFVVEAWVDAFATWRRGLSKKVDAGQSVPLELREGAALVRGAASRASGQWRVTLERAAEHLLDETRPESERVELALSDEVATGCAAFPDTTWATRAGPFSLVVDPACAAFSTWYELFPRSTGKDGEHGTFATARERLRDVAEMGFDTLYLPPIHPIGETFRKGRDNRPKAAPGDVGSPWAIGASAGGHKSVHPELGTLADFDEFVAAAADHGLRIALDVALQVSPDHPYVEAHPEWFRQRPDGSIQYAENPPKKYQDIYPFDFETAQWESLWAELKSIFEFWIERGVRTFRVDNPHTKSLAFWHWCIGELKSAHPDLVFLAEAFTRPKLMYLLAKAGFSQSYTYFTWRTTGDDLREYLAELSRPPVCEFFRPNFWPNTPDILPEHLQHAGRPVFALRLVLAATLSGNYGIYGPAFELMDNRPRPGAEEYADSEKYEIKRWALDSAASLRPLIRRVNAIRRDNLALQGQGGLRFHPADNELLLCYSKAQGESVVLVVVNLDVHHVQSGWVTLDASALALDAAPSSGGQSGRSIQLHDLLSDARYPAQGQRLFVQLDPQIAPAHIFRVRRHVRTEHDFDYFL